MRTNVAHTILHTFFYNSTLIKLHETKYNTVINVQRTKEQRIICPVRNCA